MLYELEFKRNDKFAVAHWWATPDSSNLSPLRLENALDWLWQKVAASSWKGELKVGLHENKILITENVSAPGAELYNILFTGDAREIVMQLRPYMRMMESR